METNARKIVKLNNNTEIPLSVKVADLKHIGHTVHQGERGIEIYCSLGTCNIESIFLRNIINHLGYEVDEGEDAYCSEDADWPDCIKYTTTLPWDEYLRIGKNNPMESQIIDEVPLG